MEEKTKLTLAVIAAFVLGYYTQKSFTDDYLDGWEPTSAAPPTGICSGDSEYFGQAGMAEYKAASRAERAFETYYNGFFYAGGSFWTAVDTCFDHGYEIGARELVCALDELLQSDKDYVLLIRGEDGEFTPGVASDVLLHPLGGSPILLEEVSRGCSPPAVGP